MNRITFPLMLAVSLAPVLCWGAEPQTKASDNDAAQLKALQEERIKLLDQAVKMLFEQYIREQVDINVLTSAENELCNALLDSTDEPEKRIALLTKHLEMATKVLEMANAKFNNGRTGQLDSLRAKAVCLDIKIKLLRERSRRLMGTGGGPGLTQRQPPEPVASTPPPVVPATQVPVAASVESILAHPENYIGRKVKVIGWANWIYELATAENNKKVFLSDTAKQDYGKLLRTAIIVKTKNAFPSSLIRNKQVEIVGVCDMDVLPEDFLRSSRVFIKDADVSSHEATTK